MLAPKHSREFWLNVTNRVLGSIVLILLVIVVTGLIRDAIRNLVKPSKPSLSRRSQIDAANVGTTMPDGGEQRDPDDEDRV